VRGVQAGSIGGVWVLYIRTLQQMGSIVCGFFAIIKLFSGNVLGHFHASLRYMEERKIWLPC